jgi:isocitrate/isopropylmalate dehydrogenase
MVMWDEIAAEIANEFPDVKWDKELVDGYGPDGQPAGVARLPSSPRTFTPTS